MFNAAAGRVITVMGIWMGQHIIEVEDGYVAERVTIFGQPILVQPVVEGAGIGCVCGTGDRRGGDDHEEFIGAAAEIFEHLVVDIFGVSNGQPGSWVWRIVRAACQVGVRKTGLEHDDGVLSARVGERACV